MRFGRQVAIVAAVLLNTAAACGQTERPDEVERLLGEALAAYRAGDKPRAKEVLWKCSTALHKLATVEPRDLSELFPPPPPGWAAERAKAVGDGRHWIRWYLAEDKRSRAMVTISIAAVAGQSERQAAKRLRVSAAAQPTGQKKGDQALVENGPWCGFRVDEGTLSKLAVGSFAGGVSITVTGSTAEEMLESFWKPDLLTRLTVPPARSPAPSTDQTADPSATGLPEAGREGRQADAIERYLEEAIVAHRAGDERAALYLQSEGADAIRKAVASGQSDLSACFPPVPEGWTAIEPRALGSGSRWNRIYYPENKGSRGVSVTISDDPKNAEFPRSVGLLYQQPGEIELADQEMSGRHAVVEEGAWLGYSMMGEKRSEIWVGSAGGDVEIEAQGPDSAETVKLFWVPKCFEALAKPREKTAGEK